MSSTVVVSKYSFARYHSILKLTTFLLSFSFCWFLPYVSHAKLHEISWQSPIEIDLPIVSASQGEIKTSQEFNLASVDDNALRSVAGQGLFGDIMQGVGEGSALTNELVAILDSAMPLFSLFEADIGVTGISGDMDVAFNLSEREVVIQLPSYIEEIALTNFGVKGSESSFGDIYLRDINLGNSQLTIKLY